MAHHERSENASADSPDDDSSVLQDWVFLDAPEESQLVPCRRGHEEDESWKATAATVAVSAVAGVALMGPVAGTIMAAATVSVCAEPGSASAKAQRAVRWAKKALPQSGRQKEDIFAGVAKVAKKEARKMYSTLSGAALAERDLQIKRLWAELDSSQCACNEVRSQLSSALAEALQAREEAAALYEEELSRRRSLEAIQLAKDVEVGRLTKDLEATERVWEQDAARLEAELERLANEQAAGVKTHKSEVTKLQSNLAEEVESKRCCVCLDRAKQVLFMPCRHVCCCQTCAMELTSCPMDRTSIQQKIEFIMA